MSERPRYTIILTGRLLPGHRLETVTAAVAALYETDEERVAQTFARTPRILRQNASRRMADKYQRAFQEAGAEILIVPVAAGDAEQVPPEIPKTAPLEPTVGVTDASQPMSEPIEIVIEAPHPADSDPAPPMSTALVAVAEPSTAHPVRRRPRPLLIAGLLSVPVLALGIALLLGLPRTDEPEPALPEPAAVTAADAQDSAETTAGMEAAAQDTAKRINETEVADETQPEALPVTDPEAPFGLRAGLGLDQLDAEPSEALPGQYRLRTVPRPSNAFADYRVWLLPSSGLCRLQAVTDPIDGSLLRDRFAAMEAEIDRAYRAHARAEVTLRDAGDDPANWLQALARGELYLSSVWHPLTGARLPSDLSRVTLRAEAADPVGAGRLSLEIRFANAAACELAGAVGEEAAP